VKLHFQERLNLHIPIIIAFLALSLLGGIVHAADTLKLEIDDALKMAVQSSPNMILARMDSLVNENRWHNARGMRLPQIRYSQESPSWDESVNERYIYDIDEGRDIFTRVPSGDLRWQSRVNLQQETPWGASVDISSRVYQRKWYRTVNEREEFEEYSLLNRVLVNQPLLAGNPVSRDYKLNKIDFDRGQIAFELQRRDVIYNVKSVYYGQVLAEEALKISTQDLQRGREARDLAKRKFNAGFIPEVDLMRIQVDLARRQGEFSQTEARAESAKEQLRLILGLPVNQQIAVNFPENRTNAEFGTVESISGKRLETEADELSNQGLNMRTDATITDMRIRASLQLYYEVDTRWDKTSDIDKSENRNRGVSLHFEFPIYGFGTTVTEIENLKIAKKKSVNEMKIRKANLEADTRRAVRDLDLSRRRMDIVSASLELSRKTLSISEDRFENGLINSRELIDAQADLTRGNQEWLNARIDYELAFAYLERIAPYHRQ